jgi:hypothetical protein
VVPPQTAVASLPVPHDARVGAEAARGASSRLGGTYGKVVQFPDSSMGRLDVGRGFFPSLPDAVEADSERFGDRSGGLSAQDAWRVPKHDTPLILMGQPRKRLRKGLS